MSFSGAAERERPREALDQFTSEALDHERPRAPTSAVPHARRKAFAVVGVAGVFISCIAAVAGFHLPGLRAATPSGVLSIESNPNGASVFIDGQPTGTTPASVRLRAGVHHLLVRRGTHSQELPVTIVSNASIVHHFLLPTEGTPTGTLHVISEGRRGTVTLDGVKRGVTPLTITDLGPGDHEVAVLRGTMTERRTVRIDPGATTSLVVGGGTTGPLGPETGWLAPQTSIPLQIVENGKVVGTTESDRILVPTGEHTFEFTASALGFSASRTIKIHAGQTENVVIALPTAPLSINATPWADVWIDGEALGATPIGKVLTTIGSHELVFRHPEFGERRITTIVTLKGPARVGVDMIREP